jgi:hypothetical protein
MFYILLVISVAFWALFIVKSDKLEEFCAKRSKFFQSLVPSMWMALMAANVIGLNVLY